MALTVAERIEELEALLDSGTTSVSVDGVTTTIDPDAIRARIAELKAQDAAAKSPRPRALTVDMSDTF